MPHWLFRRSVFSFQSSVATALRDLLGMLGKILPEDSIGGEVEQAGAANERGDSLADLSSLPGPSTI